MARNSIDPGHQNFTEGGEEEEGLEFGIDDARVIQEFSTDTEKQPPSGGCRNKIICLVVLLLALIGATVGLSIALLDSPNPLEFFKKEPPSRNETLEWETVESSSGLELVIENALDDSWSSTFNEYIKQWDEGLNSENDPLTLSVVQMEYDSACTPTPGRFKVCNGDYGKTDWTGINAILILNGYIVHSVAKLNDYFLENAGSAEREYTMCHEMGHGFGLAHTDENFFNFPTGECMDYTYFPQTNLSPGDASFELLTEIYGTSPAMEASAVEGATVENSTDVTSTVVAATALPDAITQQYNEAVSSVDSLVCVDCILDLGEGYWLVVHKAPAPR